MEQIASSPGEVATTTQPTLYWRAFRASVIWTLFLLLLGSVVHATESSLACPDWPTCFGTMVPEMSGGIFWEHLHRLVAGGLLLLWGAGTWYAFRSESSTRGIRVGAAAGFVLLIVQSLFGGLTVIMQLPDAVSTTHLSLAFIFLALATVLWVRSRPGLPVHGATRGVSVVPAAGAGLVFAQSVVGAAVRHTDSGLACPDIPLCLGEWVPPLVQWPIALHFGHRAFAMVVGGFVLWAAVRGLKQRRYAGWYVLATALVVIQILLGFASVGTFLAVWAVSLHTLVAASLLATLVAVATLETFEGSEGDTRWS